MSLALSNNYLYQHIIELSKTGKVENFSQEKLSVDLVIQYTQKK